MKSYSAAVAAACSIVCIGATDILEGPEFIDALLPEVAHVFGTTSSFHITLEEMNLRAEDVYVLPRAPKIDDCLSALEGMPLTRQLKPFSDSTSFMDVKAYDTAQLKIAEARAAELAASIAPLVAFAPKAKYGSGVSLASIEVAPGQYRSVVYVAFQIVLYGALVPAAIFGVRNAKTSSYIKKLLLAVTFFFNYSFVAIILQNVLGFASLVSLPVALAVGLLAMLYALRSVGSIEQLRTICSKMPQCEGREKEPMGFIFSKKLYCVVLANLSYHVISSLLPYRYGVAGIFTSNSMLAGLIYLACLMAASSMVCGQLKTESDSRKKESRVLAFACAYIATSGISFFLNLIAVYAGVGDFIAFDPSVFFTAMTTFEFNIGTIIMTLALLSMWGVGYHEQNQMDESGKNVSSVSSVALASSDESYRALTEALTEVRTRGFEM